MPVITRVERIQFIDGRMSESDKRKIVMKLAKFQESITDKAHIESINAFIPQAEREAKAGSLGENGLLQPSVYNRLFCRAMNRMTRAAGVRV